MTMLLQHSVFVHIPRTGCVWLRTLARHAGLSVMESRDDFYNHCRHCDLPASLRSLPSLCLIRHPLVWARSRWQFSLKINAYAEQRLHGIHRVFDELVQPTLADTLRAILTHRPGLIGETYREVTSGVTLVRRTRDLPGAAVEALAQLEDGDVVRQRLIAALDFCPPCNCSEPWGGSAVEVPQQLAADFLASETEAMQLWERAE